jgi:hypothetical protein
MYLVVVAVFSSRPPSSVQIAFVYGVGVGTRFRLLAWDARQVLCHEVESACWESGTSAAGRGEKGDVVYVHTLSSTVFVHEGCVAQQAVRLAHSAGSASMLGVAVVPHRRAVGSPEGRLRWYSAQRTRRTRQT